MSTSNHDSERLSALCRKVKNQRKEIKNLNKALRIQQLVTQAAHASLAKTWEREVELHKQRDNLLEQPTK